MLQKIHYWYEFTKFEESKLIHIHAGVYAEINSILTRKAYVTFYCKPVIL